MAGGASNGGGDGDTLPLGPPVSDGGDTQSEDDGGALYCETQPLDDAEAQLVEEDGAAAGWMETELVESGEEDGGDYGDQVETQLVAEREDEEEVVVGVDDNACNGIGTQLAEECEAKAGNGGVNDMVDTQLVEESGDDDDDDGDGVNVGDEVDVGEWGKTQLVEHSEDDAGDDESSEGKQLLTDNEQGAKSRLNGGDEAVNGKAEKRFDEKSVVDPDASTDEEGDADEEKQKGSNNGMHLLPPEIVEKSSCSASFCGLPDCGFDSDSQGYVQKHDKDGMKGTYKCSTAKKLFDDMVAEDDESNGKCFGGLSYIGSQEPGDLSQANAFEVVDRLIAINAGLSSQETTPVKVEQAKPRVTSKRGTLILAEKMNLSRSCNGKTEIFEWVDSREDDGGGEFFSRNKDILLKKPAGRGKQRSHPAKEKKCSMKVAPATDKIGESKDKTNSKLCGRFEAIPLSDSMLLKIDAKSKRASGNRTKKNLLKDLDDLSNAKSPERQQEMNDIAVPDVGPDTQVAIEAMETLAQCAPAETLPAKVQPSFDRAMRDVESKTVTSESKKRPLKRTSSIQEGVTTRSKRRKVPESNTKPQKQKLKEPRMQQNSELTVKIATMKKKQTKPISRKGKDLNMFADENKCHGTPVAHRTRSSGRKNLSDYELCSNKHLRKGNRETGDCSSIGEMQNNRITSANDEQIHCERISKTASLYFEKESTEPAFANGAQDLQSSRDGSTQQNIINNVQNLEPCRGEETTDVTCREPLPHPKQKRTPTAILQSKAIGVAQTAANHEAPSKLPRQSKKRPVFVRSVSDLLKYARREPSSGRSTSLLSSIIGNSLASSPILSSSVRVSRTSGRSGSVQRMKEPPHVENSSKPPENNAEDSNTVLQTPSKVANDLSPTFSPVNPSKASSRSLSKPSVARELLKLGSESALSNQRRKDSRRKDMASYSILFSHHLDENVIKRQKKILARLGVREAFSISDATHFVADSFYRTRNMLEAIALGKPVVTSMWLENCGEAGFYIDERKHILRDVKKEKELGFSMPISLASACNNPLLLGKRVFVTLKVKPSREVMISLVKAASGKPLERVGRSIMKETKVPDDLLVISCEEEYQTCAPLLERGASVFSSELVLHGIIIQKLEYERHRLFADHVKQTRSTRWLKDTVHNQFVPVSKCP